MKSGRGLPQSKTLSRGFVAMNIRQVLDCGSPLPLLHQAANVPTVLIAPFPQSGLVIPRCQGIILTMGMTVFPEWVQSQKLVCELAERLENTLNETSARAILALKFNGPTPERRRKLAAKANEGLLSTEE